MLIEIFFINTFIDILIINDIYICTYIYIHMIISKLLEAHGETLDILLVLFKYVCVAQCTQKGVY